MKKEMLISFGILFAVAVLISGCSKPEEKKAETPPVEKQIVQEKAPAVKQEMAKQYSEEATREQAEKAYEAEMAKQYSEEATREQAEQAAKEKAYEEEMKLQGKY